MTGDRAERDELTASDFRWLLEPFPSMDADELLEFDPVAAADVDNPLAVPLVAALKTIRRLTNRVRALGAVVKTLLAFVRDQHVEIERLKAQVYRLLDERRRPT
jgi:hypothetical protein